MLARKAGFSMGSPDHASMMSESEESDESGAVRLLSFLGVALGMTEAGAVDSVYAGQAGDVTLHRCRVRGPRSGRGESRVDGGAGGHHSFSLLA